MVALSFHNQRRLSRSLWKLTSTKFSVIRSQDVQNPAYQQKSAINAFKSFRSFRIIAHGLNAILFELDICGEYASERLHKEENLHKSNPCFNKTDSV